MSDSNVPWIWKQSVRGLGAFVWLYVLVTVLVATAIHGFGDVTWWGSVLLHGPRWIWAAGWPVALLAACFAGTFRQRLAVVASGLVAAFWIVGWVVPLPKLWEDWSGTRSDFVPGSPEPLQVMTLNMDGGRTDLNALKMVLSDPQLDLIALQEAPPEAEQVLPSGWSALRRGDLVIASRWPVEELQVIMREKVRWPRPIGLVAKIQHPKGEFVCGAIHPLTPRVGLMNLLDRSTLFALDRLDLWEQETQRRWDEHRRLSSEIGMVSGPLLVLGDFNAPVESRIYQTYWGRYRNAFSRSGWGPGQTIRIEERLFTLTARIDHVLTSNDWLTRRSWVGEPLGSLHLPVFAQLHLSEPSETER